MIARGQTIQIYLPTSDPAGVRIAAIPTRTVQLFEVPRSILGDFLEREESDRPAVYYLFGEDDNGEPLVYVGQSNSVGDRLRTHQSGRDHWERALVAVSLTNEWTQTHISYLEWESIRLARESGRYRVDNRNTGMQPHTPDPLRDDCREYLTTIRQLLSTLGFPAMEKPKKPVKRATVPTQGSDRDVGAPVENGIDTAGDTDLGDDDGVEVLMGGSGIDARGIYSSEGVLILAGSVGRLVVDDAERRMQWIQKILGLASSGAVEVAQDRHSYTFIRDHLFSSPSTAAAVLACDNRNGRVHFKDSSGRTIKQFEKDQAQRAADSRTAR